MTWQLSASCRGTDTNMFFPSGPDASRVTRQLAAAFCSTCPVRVPCADAGRDEHGWWGGQVGGGSDRLRLEKRAYQERPRVSAAGAARLARLVDEYGPSRETA